MSVVTASPTGTTASGLSLLNTTLFNDVVAQSPTRGDLLLANSTPEWDALGIGAANTILMSDGSDPAWATPPFLRLDCTNDPVESSDGELVVNKTSIKLQDLTAGGSPGTGPALLWAIVHSGGPLVASIEPSWDTGQSILTLAAGSSSFSFGQHASPNVVGFKMSGRMFPSADNVHDFGYTGFRWKDFYLSGNLDDGTNTVTVAALAAHIASTSNPHSVTAAQVGNTTAQWNADQVQSLAFLADTPSDGDVWVWVAANSRFELQPQSGGGASQLTDLSDVSAATPTNRHALLGNGSTFASRALVEADISDLGSYLANIVEDTTPQLGGNLDCQDYELQNVGAVISLNDDDSTEIGSATNGLRALHFTDYAGGTTSPQNTRGIHIHSSTFGDIFVGTDSEFAGFFSQKSVKAGSTATDTSETASNLYQGNWGNGSTPSYPFLEMNWGVGDGSTGIYNAGGGTIGAVVRNGAATVGYYNSSLALGGGGLVVFGRRTTAGLYVVGDETNSWMLLGTVGGAKAAQQYPTIAVGGDATAFVPDTDNAMTCGSASYRWSDVRSVLINGADYGFMNGWVIREWPASSEDVQSKDEAWFRTNANLGLQFLNDEGETIMILHRDGRLWLRGGLV